MILGAAGIAIALGVFGLVYVLTGSSQSQDRALLHEVGIDVDEQSLQSVMSAEGGLASYETLLNDHQSRQSFDLRDKIQQSVGKNFEKTERGTKLADQLQKADLKVHPTEWTGMVAGISLVFGLLCYLRFGSILWVIIGAFAAWMASRFYLKRKIGKRRKKFDSQLPGTILSLSNGVKAGYTLAQAMSLVSQNSAEPMSVELSRVVRESQLGIPFIEAFGHLVERAESEDLKLLLTAIQIQQQVGGNLAQILDNIEFTIRERIRIKGEIKSITGQARASGWILIILPFALGGILYVIAPSYFKPMLTTLPGEIMLGFGLGMLAGGYAIIRKIVNVEV